MNKKIVYIILWAVIIFTTLFNMAVGINALIAPAHEEILFRGLPLEIATKPIWFALSGVSVILQAVAATLLVGYDSKREKGFMRDIILTTIIGIICIGFTVIPVIGGVAKLLKGFGM